MTDPSVPVGSAASQPTMEPATKDLVAPPLVVVGMNNPYFVGRKDMALFPAPERSAGYRLYHMVRGCWDRESEWLRVPPTRYEWIRCTERYNLCDKHWLLGVARARGAEILPHLGNRAVLVLGRETWRALLWGERHRLARHVFDRDWGDTLRLFISVSEGGLPEIVTSERENLASAAVYGSHESPDTNREESWRLDRTAKGAFSGSGKYAIAELTCFPHPSGRCQLYNDREQAYNLTRMVATTIGPRLAELRRRTAQARPDAKTVDATNAAD